MTIPGLRHAISFCSPFRWTVEMEPRFCSAHWKVLAININCWLLVPPTSVDVHHRRYVVGADSRVTSWIWSCKANNPLNTVISSLKLEENFLSFGVYLPWEQWLLRLAPQPQLLAYVVRMQEMGKTQCSRHWKFSRLFHHHRDRLSLERIVTLSSKSLPFKSSRRNFCKKSSGGTGSIVQQGLRMSSGPVLTLLYSQYSCDWTGGKSYSDSGGWSPLEGFVSVDLMM